jgi:carboxyl-terminal processing protease
MKMMKHNLLKRFFVFSFLFSLLFVAGHAQGLDQPAKYEANKTKLLSYMIRERLETNHFNHKIIDDTVSEAAFGLYLKQLDFQKTILLQEDVEKLRKYSKLIDDEMNSGKLELAEAGSAALSARAAVVSEMVKEILSKDFDFSAKEFIETDVDKIDYCKTDAELRERWRKLLKYQVLNRYLDRTEEQANIAGDASKLSDKPEDKKKQTDEDLREAARIKVLKTYDQFFSRIAQEKEAESYERFFSAVTHAFDPHTDYMPPMNKEDFDISMSGSLEGIGATLKEDENHIKVVSIIAGSPASRQGQIQAEDIILKVGEGAGEPVDIIGMRVKDAVKLIRGKKGTEVRLTISKPDGKVLIIPIVRDIIQIEETFVKGTTIKNEKTGDNFGYIKVPSFYRDFEKTRNGSGGRNSTDDIRAELTNLKSQNIKGMIIDLRNNGGGALTDAVRIAGLFIETGPIVQVKNSDGKTTTLSDYDPDITYTGPVVILVNRLSASASEILAGALQDYSRAVIMGGEHTHGKGTVQTVIDLNENVPFQNMEEYKPLGALKLTIQKFYRISGDSTQYRGVIPDLVLPDVMNGLKTGEQYIDFAMPWDTVNPVAYTKWPKCGPDISQLRENSLKRVASDQGLIDMKTAAIRLEEKKKNTLKSLNIDEVRKEIEESRKQNEKDPEASHGHSKANDKAKTPEEKKEAFIKETAANAYVKEAMSVIEDIIKADPSCISITAN